MKYEYMVMSSLPLPPPKHRRETGPMMSEEEMEWVLNDFDKKGWEFVGFGMKQWINGPTQQWWIFRKAILSQKKREGE